MCECAALDFLEDDKDKEDKDEDEGDFTFWFVPGRKRLYTFAPFPE